VLSDCLQCLYVYIVQCGFEPWGRDVSAFPPARRFALVGFQPVLYALARLHILNQLLFINNFIRAWISISDAKMA
jgi:hypothetical protein